LTGIIDQVLSKVVTPSITISALGQFAEAFSHDTHGAAANQLLFVQTLDTGIDILMRVAGDSHDTQWSMFRE
jgi:hypothetical protein